MFHDIFSKNSEKVQEKIEILVDNREKNSLVPSELIKLNFKIEFKQLEIADYIINNKAIERKTVSDLKNSIINKRIFDQLEQIKKYESYFLIIEGNIEELFNNEVLHENAIRGFILATQEKFKVPIIIAKNEKDTARYLDLISRKKDQKKISLNPKRTSLSLQEQKQYVLESFPGIGQAKAKILLDKFKTLKNIFNSSEEELKYILKGKTKDFIDFLTFQ